MALDTCHPAALGHTNFPITSRGLLEKHLELVPVSVPLLMLILSPFLSLPSCLLSCLPACLPAFLPSLFPSSLMARKVGKKDEMTREGSHSSPAVGPPGKAGRGTRFTGAHISGVGMSPRWSTRDFPQPAKANVQGNQAQDGPRDHGSLVFLQESQTIPARRDLRDHLAQSPHC